MTAPIPEEEIRKRAEQIGQEFHVHQIILFGSHSNGKATADSDVDLMVTMDTALRSVQQAVEIRKKIRFPFPVDLIVRTPAQIRERLALGDPFIREIVSKGKVLYEAA